MCSAVPIILGVLSAGLSIVQQQQAVAAQNAQIDAANAQAEQTFQFNRLQAESQRTHEQQKAWLREDRILQNNYFADQAFHSDIAQYNLRFMQEQQAAAWEKRKKSIESLEKKGQIIAAGRTGNSVTNLIADVKRQEAYFDFATGLNMAFTGKQIQQKKKGATTKWATARASVQPYLQQTILDPIKPIKRPRMKGPGWAGYASAALSGVQVGMGAYSFGQEYKQGWLGYKKPPTGSSRLLKENIFKVGKSPTGINIYSFNYIGQIQRYIGVIAEELIPTRPEALAVMPGGHLGVHYDLIDVDFKAIT
jgi:hypothetical protein